MQAADLSPLHGLPLTHLMCGGTKVTDLTPLRGMPLVELKCDFKPQRDAAVLRSLRTLEIINGKPAKEFWKEVDAGPDARGKLDGKQPGPADDADRQTAE